MSERLLEARLEALENRIHGIEQTSADALDIGVDMPLPPFELGLRHPRQEVFGGEGGVAPMPSPEPWEVRKFAKETESGTVDIWGVYGQMWSVAYVSGMDEGWGRVSDVESGYVEPANYPVIEGHDGWYDISSIVSGATPGHYLAATRTPASSSHPGPGDVDIATSENSNVIRASGYVVPFARVFEKTLEDGTRTRTVVNIRKGRIKEKLVRGGGIEVCKRVFKEWTGQGSTDPWKVVAYDEVVLDGYEYGYVMPYVREMEMGDDPLASWREDTAVAEVALIQPLQYANGGLTP